MKKIVSTDRAPAAVGPYSQAVRVSAPALLFCSGQIALPAAGGELVGRSAADQCRQVMDNLKAVLQAAGASLSDVVKTTIFLVNMDDFRAVNEVYASYFSDQPPARATVEVNRLPLDAVVEIEAIAELS